MKQQSGRFAFIGAFVLAGSLLTAGAAWGAAPSNGAREANPPATADERAVTAIVGARLFDGLGGPPVPDAVVLVEGGRIRAAGAREDVGIPEGAERFDGRGMTVLPGLVDAHFHSINDNRLLERFLERGLTAVRDPGHPIGFYQSLYFARRPQPRVFLTGAHLDGYPPVWPQQAVVVRDAEHARRTVQEHVDAGASAIKIYYRLPLEYYPDVVDAARERRVPVTVHLELVDVDDAIRAGVAGVEHVTSFGTALAERQEAERFKRALRERDDARLHERYRLWATLDLDAPRVESLIRLALERGIVFVPTLAVFERRAGVAGVEEFEVAGFRNMLRFVQLAHQGGVTIVAGSHTWVRHVETGWAMQRELELLVEAGMSASEALVAGTSASARWLGIDERLGAIVPGHQADLVLVAGDPTADIRAMYEVRRVMLAGRWVRGQP